MRTGLPWKYLLRDHELGCGSGIAGGACMHGNRLVCGNASMKPCKFHLLVDQRGLPLVASISGDQVHDCRMLFPLLEVVPSVAGLAGRSPKRQARLHADKAYASRAHRA
jgi:hypothetical protein